MAVVALGGYEVLGAGLGESDTDPGIVEPGSAGCQAGPRGEGRFHLGADELGRDLRGGVHIGGLALGRHHRQIARPEITQQFAPVEIDDDLVGEVGDPASRSHDVGDAAAVGQWVARRVGDVRALAAHVVVPEAVPEAADPSAPDVRAGDELSVLEGDPVLGETQAECVEVRAPEQFVGGQAEERLARVQVHRTLVDRLPSGVGVALGDDGRQHHVADVLVGERDQVGQQRGLAPVVGVGEEQIPALADVDADVAGPAGPSGIGLVDHMEAVVRRRDLVAQVLRAVGRSVIHEPDVERPGGLAPQAVQ